LRDKYFSVSRIIKVGLKNFYRIHYRYLVLLKKNKPLSHKKVVEKENIFVITSCLNPDDGNNYNHNPSHKLHDRLEETLLGIASIRNNFPDAYVIILDNSRIPPEETNILCQSVDEYFDYSNDKEMKTSRKHFNKGVPQFAKLAKFCEENYPFYKSGIFHFMSARYQIVENITGLTHKQGTFFLYYNEFKNVSTRYYYFRNVSLQSIGKVFRKTLYCAILGNSVEDALYMFVPAML